MKLYKATVKWYDSYSEDFKTDLCYAFTENIADLMARIEHNFNDVEDIQIKLVNLCDNEDQLLWIPIEDGRTQYIIETENNY